MKDKQITFLDQLGQLFPLLDAMHMRIICEVGDNPNQSMSEIAERLDIGLPAIFFNVRTLADGDRARNPYTLMMVERCQNDRRKQRVRLTQKGYEVAKLIQPLNVPVTNEPPVKKEKQQLDFFQTKKVKKWGQI